MRNISYFLPTILYLTVLLGYISSCEKLDTPDEQNIIKTSFPSLDSINFQIVDNTLVFGSYDDFYRMRDYLEETPNARSSEFDNYIGFHSLREELKSNEIICSMDNDDMLAMLNPNYAIVIGGYEFIYEIDTETIDVTNIDESEGLKAIRREFNWNDDVEGIVFFNKPLESKKSTLQTIYEDVYTWSASNNTEITAKIRYDHIPLFYEFFVKIKKTAFRPGVEIYYEFGSNYMGSQYPTYWKRSSGACNEDTGYSDDDTGSSLKYQIINKKLDGCYGHAYFISTDNYQGPPIYHTQGAYVAKERDKITCD